MSDHLSEVVVHLVEAINHLHAAEAAATDDYQRRRLATLADTLSALLRFVELIGRGRVTPGSSLATRRTFRSSQKPIRRVRSAMRMMPSALPFAWRPNPIALYLRCALCISRWDYRSSSAPFLGTY